MTKFIRKIVTYVLLLAMVGSCISTNFVYASSNENNKNIQEGKTNFVMLSTDLNHVEYTYDESGKSFKVIEKSDEDLKHIESTIYEKTGESSYKVFSKMETEVQDGVMTIETNQNGTITTENLDLNPLIEEVKLNPDGQINLANEKSFISKSSANPPLGPWTFNGDFSGSTKFKRLTVTIVAAALATIIVGPLTAGNPVAVNVAVAVATIVVSDNIPIVYYSQRVYYRHIKDTYLPRAERTLTKFFEDSAKRHQIDGTVEFEYYVPGWEQ